MTSVQQPWGELLDADEVADACQDADALTITHSETSTGALHDLAAIAAAAKALNPDLLIIVDAVTSYGVAELRAAAWNVEDTAPPGLRRPPPPHPAWASCCSVPRPRPG